MNNARMLENSIRMLDERCIQGITANEIRCAQHVENSIGLLTALVPHIGYENASYIAGHALLSGSGVAELVRQEKLLSDEELAAILSPDRMVSSI